MCFYELVKRHHRSARAGSLALLLACAVPVNAIGDIVSTTQMMTATVVPYGKLSVPSSISLRSADTRFGALTGALTVSYWARTSDGGGGAMTIQASEFAPTGGPASTAVTYICSGATLGAGCSGTQSLSTATQTSVVSLPGGACTGGGGVCSTQDANSVLVSFLVPSKPEYKTGSYSAQITFTISTL